MSLVPQLAPWLLLGFAAWMLSRDERGSLIPIGAASLLHYLGMFAPAFENRKNCGGLIPLLHHWCTRVDTPKAMEKQKSLRL